MSSTAFRAVRELRGEASVSESRPGTSAGGRPTTSSGSRPSTTSSSDDATTADLRRELEDARLALEKEKRNSRALEQYLTELGESKDAEIREIATEAKQATASLQRAEAHAVSLEEIYKSQLSKLTLTVERLQAKPASAREAEEAFSAVLREEMRSMQAAYQLKLDRAQAELAARTSEYTKQVRVLNESLVDERRKNVNMVEKMTSLRAAANNANATARPASGTTAAAASTTSAATPKASTTTKTSTKTAVKK